MPHKSPKFIVIIRVFKLGLIVDPTQDSGYLENLNFFYKLKQLRFSFKK